MTAIHPGPSRSDAALALSVTAVGVTAIVLASIGLGMMPAIVAVGIPAAVAAALYLMRRPTVMLGVLVVLEVTNLAAVLAQRIPISIATPSLGLGLLTVGLALRDPVMRSRLNRRTLVCFGLIVAYLITQLLATIGGQSVELSVAALKDSVTSCLFLGVILVLTQLTGKPWTVAAAFVVPLAVISVLCVISLVGSGGSMSFGGIANVTHASGQLTTTPRFAGPLEDSNFWGRHLILALPLAGALIVRAVRFRRQWIALAWWGALLALLAGVYLTQSRGTLMATAIAFFVWVLASGPAARRWGLMSLPLVALTVLVPGIGNRIVALATDVANPDHAIDPSVVGRMHAQEMAWAMFRDRPIFGIGPGDFASSVPRYAGTVHTAVLHPTDAPHNLYAQLAADSGVVGLVGWIIFVGGFTMCLASRVARSSGTDNSDRSLGAAVLAGLIAWSFASVFLHLAYFRTFAIVLALAGVWASTAGSNQGRGVREMLWSARHGVVGIVFGAAAVTAVLVMSTSVTHTVSQTVTLQPKAELGWDVAYALDVKTRETLLPTYAAMMAPGGHRAAAMADPVRGVIVISANNTDLASARADLDTALVAARTHLADVGADSWCIITPVGEPTSQSDEKRTATSIATAVAVGTLVAAGSALTSRRRWTRRSRCGQAGISQGSLMEVGA